MRRRGIGDVVPAGVEFTLDYRLLLFTMGGVSLATQRRLDGSLRTSHEPTIYEALTHAVGLLCAARAVHHVHWTVRPGFLACYLPARRAAHLDPTVVLRQD